MKARIERAQVRIDRWNKRPKLIMFFACTVGFPPLYLMAFIAGPLMKMLMRTPCWNTMGVPRARRE